MPNVQSLPPKAAELTVASTLFTCEFHAEGRGAAWVRVRGELDLTSATQFKQTLHEALEHALLVIIDLRALTFMDSTGLHAIMEADARARRSGHRLVLIRGSGQVDRLLKLVGVTDRLRILDLPAAHAISDASAYDAAC